MSSRGQFPRPPELPRLLQPPDEAAALLERRISAGEALEQRLQRSPQTGPGVERDAEAWHEENEILLARLFTAHDEYTRYRHLPSGPGLLSDVADVGTLGLLRQRLRFLRSLRHRLEHFAAVPRVRSLGRGSRKVFVVHGHDVAVKLEVAEFLRRLGLEPVILDREPDGGRFLLEKFEDHADVPFALALLTPDDSAGGGHRARQNVMLELGFFLGRLGRARVRALYKPGVEVPSDILGWLYIELDGHGAWKHKLVRELLDAGFHIDRGRCVRALQ